MTDEANPYFWASIDNIIEGHQFLNRELGVMPKVAWSNDPFGYGPSVPYLFAKAGIQRLAVNRVHKTVKMELEKTQSAVFWWRQQWDRDGANDVLTHVLPYQHYDVPNSCGPDPAICCQFDFKRLTNFQCPGPMPELITADNVHDRAKLLLNQYRLTSTMYRYNVLLLMLGDDFRFTDEEEWYQQYENYMKLFRYMNSRTDWNVEAKFGTFSDYFNALKDRAPQDQDKNGFPSLMGDFFPYNDFSDHYWTGYYTTRPFFKRMDRFLQSHIRAADIVSTLAFATKGDLVTEGGKRSMMEMLTQARRNLALFQHHDAITGTSKVPVMKDYGERLFRAVRGAASVIGAAVQLLLTRREEAALNPLADIPPNAVLDDYLSFVVNELPLEYNATETKIPILFQNASDTRKVVVYNSLPHHRTETVRLLVSTPFVAVVCTERPTEALPAQINPVIGYQGGIRKDLYELAFDAALAPLGAASFSLTAKTRRPAQTRLATVRAKPPIGRHLFPSEFRMKSFPSGQIRMVTRQMTTLHDSTTGLIQEVAFNDSNLGRQRLAVEFAEYTNTRSGAYLFIPNKHAQPWSLEGVQMFLVSGPLMSQMHTFLPRLYHSVTVNELDGWEGREVHLENTVDIREVQNSEPIMRLATGLQTESVFHTDSIGLQMMRRRNHSRMMIETNYYPMPHSAVLQSKSKRLTLFSGQPHGCRLYEQGALEVMLDRILTYDDYKGLGQDSLVRDNLPTKSRFTIVVEKRLENGGDMETFKKMEKKVLGQSTAGRQEKLTNDPPVYHSMLAQYSSQRLLYPPIVLHDKDPVYSTTDALPLNATPLNFDTSPGFSMGPGFACDSSLLMLRPLPDVGPNERLVMLHRTGTDCGVMEEKHTCFNGSTALAFSELMGALGVSKLQETNLSGIDKKGPPIDLESNPESLLPDPMNLRTFRISIDSSKRN